ncbi:hypothetical protein BCR34DRAFT_106345 [Clohesyomyces aquaticus]|uniref:Uncharacterized protein n=1 Tax=Clohesyomyces aquaticus TaxID=1231657 RepID=A0A1Y2A365_9PLEO|nr:hypothetical protein BCR34DRAFT_106345 [Clohesyomyces aquaticus]
MSTNLKATPTKKVPYPPKKCTTKLYRFLYSPTGTAVTLAAPCLQPTCKTCRSGMNWRWIDDNALNPLPGDNDASLSPLLTAQATTTTTTTTPDSANLPEVKHMGLRWRTQSPTSSTSTAHDQSNNETTNAGLEDTTDVLRNRPRKRQRTQRNRSALIVHCRFDSEAGKQRFALKIGEAVGREALPSMLASYVTGGMGRNTGSGMGEEGRGLGGGVMEKAAGSDVFPLLPGLDEDGGVLTGIRTSGMVKDGENRGESTNSGSKRKSCGSEQDLSDRKRPRVRHRVRLLFRSKEGKGKFRDIVREMDVAEGKLA